MGETENIARTDERNRRVDQEEWAEDELAHYVCKAKRIESIQGFPMLFIPGFEEYLAPDHPPHPTDEPGVPCAWQARAAERKDFWDEQGRRLREHERAMLRYQWPLPEGERNLAHLTDWKDFLEEEAESQKLLTTPGKPAPATDSEEEQEFGGDVGVRPLLGTGEGEYFSSCEGEPRSGTYPYTPGDEGEEETQDYEPSTKKVKRRTVLSPLTQEKQPPTMSISANDMRKAADHSLAQSGFCRVCNDYFPKCVCNLIG